MKRSTNPCSAFSVCLAVLGILLWVAVLFAALMPRLAAAAEDSMESGEYIIWNAWAKKYRPLGGAIGGLSWKQFRTTVVGMNGIGDPDRHEVKNLKMPVPPGVAADVPMEAREREVKVEWVPGKFPNSFVPVFKTDAGEAIDIIPIATYFGSYGSNAYRLVRSMGGRMSYGDFLHSVAERMDPPIVNWNAHAHLSLALPAPPIYRTFADGEMKPGKARFTASKVLAGHYDIAWSTVPVARVVAADEAPKTEVPGEEVPVLIRETVPFFIIAALAIATATFAGLYFGTRRELLKIRAERHVRVHKDEPEPPPSEHPHEHCHEHCGEVYTAESRPAEGGDAKDGAPKVPHGATAFALVNTAPVGRIAHNIPLFPFQS